MVEPQHPVAKSQDPSITAFVATLKTDDGWVLPRQDQPFQREKVKRFLKAVAKVLEREPKEQPQPQIALPKPDISQIPPIKVKGQQRERLSPLLVTQIKTRIEELKTRTATLDDSQKATQLRQRIVALQAMIKGY